MNTTNIENKNRVNKKSGFFQLIILLIIAIVILKFWLDIDIVDFLNSTRFQIWIGYVKTVLLAFWENVIEPLINVFRK